MKFTWLLGLTLLMIVPSSRADSNCSKVDLRTEFNWKMRNQGDISWCYAHAAADFLQFNQNLSTPISAADIALEYNHRRWPRFLKWLTRSSVPETGFIKNAILDIAPQGYCPESKFPSEVWNKRILRGEQAGTLLQVPLKQALQEILLLSRNTLGEETLNNEGPSFAYEFEEVDAAQFLKLIEDFGPNEILDALREAACGSHREPFLKPIGQIERSYKNRESMKIIDSVLDQHQALTVDFFYGVLNNRDDFSYDFSELHTTLLVGRRYNEQEAECEYLIKNSYGTDCSEYDPRHECDGGYVWVSKSSLDQSMTSLTVIRAEPKAINQTAEPIPSVRRFRLRSILSQGSFRILRALFHF